MIKVFPNIEELNAFAAEKFVEIANQATGKRGRFTVALAGGSTPKSLYQLLSSDSFKDKIDWSRAYFFFGDERSVLPDSDESNFRMANESLFNPLKIIETHIFRWQTELGNAEITAEKYELSIKEIFDLPESGFPKFDLILLGIGADGHTASLFPFTKALRETEKIAVANYVEKLQTMRFTMTLPTINNARNVLFLVKGADKAATLRDVLEGEFEPEKLPSQNIKPANGNLLWLCDAESAALLKSADTK